MPYHTFFVSNQFIVYKQLALVWQIAKQLSGLNPLSLSNNKNYRLNKEDFFVSNERKNSC